DFSDAVNLWTVGYCPPEGSFTTVTLTNRSVFRYIRYLSPPNGSCNVAELQFYGGTNPAAPTGLSATPGLNQVLLGWNAVAGMSYNVMRSTNSGGPYASIATNLATSTFTDTNGLNGQVYFYVASAVNPVGLVSSTSGEASATPFGPPE